ncbi:hypothetical protein, partial [Cronobacter sakazakii]|uniref:hypothetical protein n=1 Tax=Cronobacter sakazakii TaxID=28141 RepID=UPI001F3A6595
ASGKVGALRLPTLQKMLTLTVVNRKAGKPCAPVMKGGVDVKGGCAALTHLTKDAHVYRS